MEEISVETDTGSFEAFFADNFLRHFLGMRFRSEGKMLFKFHRKSRPRIDMLFVPKTLYLYFLDSDKKVIDVQKAEPWSWNPRTWRFYRPKVKSEYLLESFRPMDLEEGEKLDWKT